MELPKPRQSVANQMSHSRNSHVALLDGAAFEMIVLVNEGGRGGIEGVGFRCGGGFLVGGAQTHGA